MEFMSRLTQQWQRWWRCWGRSLLVMLLTSGILWCGSMATATAATVEEGKTLFEQSCASCHSIDGSGASYGPDLKTVTQRRDRNWLVNWIAAPEKAIESGDAIAQELVEQYNGVPMPNMGLQPNQVESIVVYLENAAGNAIATSPEIEAPATAPSIAGDANIGQKLFAGTIGFQNGGPACMSCHTVNPVGALKGGTLGPNLTHVIDRYTEVGLQGVLPTLPFPTMQSIYQNSQLTEAEQAHLLAFFKAANQSETPNTSSTEVASFHLSSTWKFILLGVGGFLLLALLSQITWRDRLTGVRQRLVEGNKS
ncbi:MAG TPA: cytochrome C [Cyanobacteria bacterium UBA11369]|nr:cytochrome C [Cyanobacteria bacterium UBA11371]HBE32172.1 cytochrome C [Cyanobacteria bacterium UBA11368]HBE49324.1 cytochrome C [Cyanobacteria bacterium UBA11369]